MSWNAPGSGTGSWFSEPEATCRLLARSAATTSEADSARAAISSGFSQIRIENSRSANTRASPTPSSRASRSMIWVLA